MNYWVFVHKPKNKTAVETFPQLIEKKDWGFRSSSKDRINSLQKGDVVLFYLGGRNCMCFSGEARLASNAYSPTREPIGDPEKLDFMVSFNLTL